MSTTNGREKKTKEQKFVPGWDGLDDELASFINSLIDQNAELAGKLQNIDSLKRLAEKTVIEAGKEAKDIKIEAEKEANARAASIVARAEEKAKAAAQKIIARAKEKTEEEARRIIAEAGKRAGESVQKKLSLAEQQAQEIMKAVEERGSQIIAEAQLIRKEAEQLLASSQKTEGCQATRDPWDVPDELYWQPEGFRETKAVSMAEEKPPEPPVSDAAVSIAPAASVEEPLEQPSPGKEEEDKKEIPASYDDTAELVLLPPVVLDRMLKLHRHLKNDPRVKVVAMKGSLDKGVRIKLLVQAHTPLLSMLTFLPEVERVSDELIEAENISSAHRNGDGARPRTIAVTMKK